MAYIGCALFGLMFLVMMSQANGSFAERMGQSAAWLHGWAPYSYILIALFLAVPGLVMFIIHSWPKHKEPEDPMAKYRHGHDVIED